MAAQSSNWISEGASPNRQTRETAWSLVESTLPGGGICSAIDMVSCLQGFNTRFVGDACDDLL